MEQPLRRAEFDDLFTRAISIERSSDSHARFRLASRPGLADEVSDLAARESECCSFFTFAVTSQPSGDVVLDVEVPPGQVDVLDAMVARASQQAAR